MSRTTINEVNSLIKGCVYLAQRCKVFGHRIPTAAMAEEEEFGGDAGCVYGLISKKGVFWTNELRFYNFRCCKFRSFLSVQV